MSNVTDIKYQFRRIKEDKHISLAIMSTYAVLTIQYLILFYFKISESSLGSQLQLLSKAIVGLLFLLSVATVIKRNWQFLICIYLLFAGIFIYNLFVFPQNTSELKSIIFPFFFTCIPSFVFSYSIDNRKVFMDITYKISNVVLVIGTFIGILIFLKRIDIGKYSMPLSYYMLLPAIVNAYVFFREKSIISALKCITAMAIVLSIGSRGAVMCFGVYVILAFIKNLKKLTHTYALIYSIIISACVILLVFMENILMLVYEIFLVLGVKSRTLLLFLQEPFHSSGRDWRYDAIIEQIKENPLSGIGICGDRVILGGYSHNLFIEIFSGFGIVVGSIILVALVYLCFKTIFSRDEFDSNIIILWFSIGFVPLMVSGSYLTDFKFWLFLGLVVRIMVDKYNKQNRTSALEIKTNENINNNIS